MKKIIVMILSLLLSITLFACDEDKDILFEDLTVVYDANSFLEDEGYKLMKNVLLEKNDLEFEAIVCSNDELAFGTIKALNEYGYEVPHDCLVAGFDNVDKSKLINPSLTTINIDWFKCGETIANLALSILEDKPCPKHIVIPANLVCRNSTKRNSTKK